MKEPRQAGWTAALAVLAAGALVAVLVARQNRWGFEAAARRLPGVTSPEVPGWVGQAVRCLQGMGASRFRVAGRLAADYQAYQPVVLVAWPIEVDASAPLVVVADEELSTLACKVGTLCRSEGVTVADCPP